MTRFSGEKCIVCSEEFKKDDTIVVCPECGTPYHRDCYDKEGRCINDDLHSSGESWQPLREEINDAIDERKCTRCGALNPPSGLFCDVCGTPLDKVVNGRESMEEQIPNPMRTMPLNPFINPFGGVNPDETIEGVSATEIAIFLGQSTHYFLPQFKRLSTKKSIFSWNWGAFMLNYFYAFFRKLNGFAVAAFILIATIQIPSTIVILDEYFKSMSLFSRTFNPVLVEKMMNLSGGVAVIVLIARFLIGALFNWFYMKYTVKTIKSIKERYEDTQQYHVALAKRGGTSLKGILWVFALQAIMYGFLLLMFFK